MEKSLRKQIKEDMRNDKPVIGLVSIENKFTNKKYIEGSINARALINRIRYSLNSGQFGNKKLQEDWNEIGEQCFLFEIISEIVYDASVSVNYRKEVLKLEKTTLKKCHSDFYNEVAK